MIPRRISRVPPRAARKRGVLDRPGESLCVVVRRFGGRLGCEIAADNFRRLLLQQRAKRADAASISPPLKLENEIYLVYIKQLSSSCDPNVCLATL